MAVTISKFNSFLATQMNGGAGTLERVVDFDTDNLKVSLLTNAFVPSLNTQATWSNVSASEVTGGNYTAGGIALTAKTLTNTSGLVAFDAADVTWSASASGFSTARYAVIYKVGSTAANSTLVAIIDFGADKTNVGGDFSIVWDASGIITWN